MQRQVTQRFLFGTFLLSDRSKRKKLYSLLWWKSTSRPALSFYSSQHSFVCLNRWKSNIVLWGSDLVWGCSLERIVSLYRQGLLLVTVKLLRHVLRLFWRIQLNFYPPGAQSDSDKKLTGWGTTMHADANIHSWKPLHSTTVWSLSLFAPSSHSRFALPVQRAEPARLLPSPPGQLIHHLQNRFNTELSEKPFASLSLKQLLQRQCLSQELQQPVKLRRQTIHKKPLKSRREKSNNEKLIRLLVFTSRTLLGHVQDVHYKSRHLPMMSFLSHV